MPESSEPSEFLSLARDVDAWVRIGHGRELQFFCSDREIEEWLPRFLPGVYSPFGAIAVFHNQLLESKAFFQEPCLLEINDIVSMLQERGCSSFWLYSRLLSKPIFSQGDMESNAVEKICNLAGFIRLRHGAVLSAPRVAGKKDSSRIAIAHQIMNIQTGETHFHKQYYEVFKALQKGIRGEMKYSTFQEFDDGSVREDRRVQLMSQEAFLQAQRGILFRNRPGNLLRR